MENLSRLGRRIRDDLAWRSESRKRKEIAKEMKLEVEKAEAERLYWLMVSCIEFAENIEEKLQIATDNPVVLGDAKFWIRTQVEMIKASWWPRTYTWNFLALECIYTIHLRKPIRMFICCCQELVGFSELNKQKVYRIPLSTTSSSSQKKCF